jgi:O-Antigen ligase
MMLPYPSQFVTAYLLLGGAFFLSIKLSLAYAFLGLGALSLILSRTRLKKKILPAPPDEFLTGLLFFISTGLSSLVGVAPVKSIISCVRHSSLSLLIPFFTYTALTLSPLRVVSALLCGQGVAAFITFLEHLNLLQPSRFLPGAVTESGQLCLIIPIFVGLIIHLWNQRRIPSSFSLRVFSARWILLSLLGFLLLYAFLFNLKRGPWLGVLSALIVVIGKYKRHLLPLMAIPLIVTFVSITPLRVRLLQSFSDFLIEGGRFEIWSVGFLLASHFPFGIGFGNSPLLRDYSYQIPPDLTHFHSNFLQIIVENGFLSGGVYFYWMSTLIWPLFSKRESPLVTSCRAALLSWQIAGLVEYNFGDSEVVGIAFILMGVLASLRKESQEACVVLDTCFKQ